jgi:hypothetical protein
MPIIFICYIYMHLYIYIAVYSNGQQGNQSLSIDSAYHSAFSIEWLTVKRQSDFKGAKPEEGVIPIGYGSKERCEALKVCGSIEQKMDYGSLQSVYKVPLKRMGHNWFGW